MTEHVLLYKYLLGGLQDISNCGTEETA